MPARLDLHEKRFGRLLVLSRGKNRDKYTTWLCRCDCGKEKMIATILLVHGKTRSCGCYRVDVSKKRMITHGESCDQRKGVLPSNKFIMYHGAKGRAKKYNIPFNLEISDIEIPKFCPVFPHLELKRKTGNVGPSENSPSLDRIIPSLGYVKGNICVISHKANSIKQTASPEELIRVAKWLKRKIINMKFGEK